MFTAKVNGQADSGAQAGAAELALRYAQHRLAERWRDVWWQRHSIVAAVVVVAARHAAAVAGRAPHRQAASYTTRAYTAKQCATLAALCTVDYYPSQLYVCLCAIKGGGGYCCQTPYTITAADCYMYTYMFGFKHLRWFVVDSVHASAVDAGPAASAERLA